MVDQSVQAVLDIYHEHIREERAHWANGPQGGPRGGQTPDLDNRLLAVGPETGQLLNILARSYTAPTILEIGTSFGYSGIWLAEAARASGGKVITLELAQHKSDHAREQATKAGLADFIDFRVGDAVKLIGELDTGIDFILLDLWKDLYVPCLEAFYPLLNPGAIVVADNIVRPGGADVQRYVDAVRAKPGITSVLLPVGSGIEVSRYDPT